MDKWSWLDYSPWGLKELDMTEWLTVLLRCPLGFPRGSVVKRICLQCRSCRRHWFNPWVGKITWRRAWKPTPVFLPWRIQWKEEPSVLQSMGSHRIGHDWVNWACMHTLPPKCTDIVDLLAQSTGVVVICFFYFLINIYFLLFWGHSEFPLENNSAFFPNTWTVVQAALIPPLALGLANQLILPYRSQCFVQEWAWAPI